MAEKLSMSRNAVARLALAQPHAHKPAGSQRDGFVEQIAAMLTDDPTVAATVPRSHYDRRPMARLGAGREGPRAPSATVVDRGALVPAHELRRESWRSRTGGTPACRFRSRGSRRGRVRFWLSGLPLSPVPGAVHAAAHHDRVPSALLDSCTAEVVLPKRLVVDSDAAAIAPSRAGVSIRLVDEGRRDATPPSSRRVQPPRSRLAAVRVARRTDLALDALNVGLWTRQHARTTPVP